jgi:hypothetical protein
VVTALGAVVALPGPPVETALLRPVARAAALAIVAPIIAAVIAPDRTVIAPPVTADNAISTLPVLDCISPVAAIATADVSAVAAAIAPQVLALLLATLLRTRLLTPLGLLLRGGLPASLPRLLSVCFVLLIPLTRAIPITITVTITLRELDALFHE